MEKKLFINVFLKIQPLAHRFQRPVASPLLQALQETD
jgi:hypothetical protein